jgi:AcrR family transcriptional regulator
MDPAETPQPPPEPQPSPARRGRADHKESVRREILDAARELFVCEGYGNVSLRKIAGRIGYTPMAIYVHFRDKSEILDCICEETFSCFRATAERLDGLGLPPRERLAAGMRSYIEFGLEHPHHYQLTFMNPPCGRQDLGRRNEIGQECYQRMRRRVALCMAAPEPPLGALAELGAEELPAALAPAEIAERAGEPGQAALDLCADSLEVELASQAIWTAMHGLVSLLIARPEFQWVERERLIEAVVQGALRSLEPVRA